MAEQGVPRRAVLASLAAGAAATAAEGAGADTVGKAAQPRNASPSPRELRELLKRRVDEMAFVDTHEHLLEEATRLGRKSGRREPADDWSYLFSHYLDSDLLAAGMPQAEYDRFFSPDVDPLDKWRILEPWWPPVRTTGYGRAVEIALRELYEVESLSAATVARVQAGYERLVRPGFYAKVLREIANVSSAQVNNLEAGPFLRSEQPTLLLQDLAANAMIGADVRPLAAPAGVQVSSLADWHRVIDWWFAECGEWAVAVKSSHAYQRNLDHAQVPAEAVQDAFRRQLAGEPLSSVEKKAAQDHLFWHVARRATQAGLPLKLHTGYHAQWAGKDDRMPLGQVAQNPAAASALCEAGRDVRFVFMHMGYPYQEEMVAVAKQNPNAWIDLCWAWILNPVAARDFLKRFLVGAPSNKLLTFGGDYLPIEPVVGHARIARNGIAAALAELVEEDWLTLDDALALVEPLMAGNARSLFALDAKQKKLATAPWLQQR